MATTSCTNTGVNTIALSTMSTFQIMVLYFSSLAGSHILVSLVVVIVRKYYFNKRFREVVLFNKARKARELHRRRQNSLSSSTSKPNHRPIINVLLHSGSPIGVGDGQRPLTPSSDREPGIIGPLTMPLEHQHQHHLRRLRPNKDIVLSIPQNQQDETEEEEDVSQHSDPATDEKQQQQSDNHSRTAGGANIIFADNIVQQREAARQRLEAQRKLEEGRLDSGPADHQQPPAAADDDHDMTDVLSLAQDQTELTREQRYCVGGAEYRALDLLTIVIPSYYVGIVLVASLAFRLYIAVSPYAQHVLLVTNSEPVNPWALSFFISLSAMNNLGLSQIDASMVPFQNSPFPLLLCGFLVLAGNTAYPIFLRFTLWGMYRMTPKSYVMHRETLRYLLDHPRRCYTTLFPAGQTWWLLAILIVINLTEVVVYVATNYWLPVMDGIPIASQLLDALFQGIVTRNAGFAVVNVAALNPGTILVYIVAMYIGVYPVAISMRNSNVYQERSLGMYRTETELPETDNYDNSGGVLFRLRKQRTVNSVMTTSKKIFHQPDFFVMTQIQQQLSQDICWVIVGVFCVCVLEAPSIMSPSPVTIASVIYECVSAFGCVGSSFGGTIPGTSQSTDYRTVSKLVIILLMYRGRHRSLPAAIDRAVLLPSEQLEQSDSEEHRLSRLHRSSSCFNTIASITTNPASIRVYRRSDTL